MKAMILAAGLGTRLKPFTDHHPKALAVVNQKTLLERNIRYLAAHGITDIIVNVHHFAEQILEFVEQHTFNNVTISLSDERDTVLETGGGLKKASWFFDDKKDFVLMNVDILTTLNLTQMIEFHLQHKALATLAMSDRNSSRCLLWNYENQLCGWKNKANGEEKIALYSDHYSEKSFSGIHVINPAIFELITEEGKFSIIDSYLRLAPQHPIVGYDHTGQLLLDVGKPESILIAEQYFH
jgi:Nucleoside-diphosphate-sugar pyrophosphorylase involved in lipopolysaccharide biosynthesis/translation initiation factor 2B, gamma/epsilon subunits (eIF-2Bgamma/eIF-2Bepsilon)